MSSYKTTISGAIGALLALAAAKGWITTSLASNGEFASAITTLTVLAVGFFAKDHAVSDSK